MADQSPLICRDIHKTFDQHQVLKGISLAVSYTHLTLPTTPYV